MRIGRGESRVYGGLSFRNGGECLVEIFQIIMAIEEEFDVVIDENAIEMIETVEQAYQAIGQSEDI